ncbi:zinc finger CCCH domain-containing protein 7-like isoform X1 [Typha angustifolia]|uniref:zinc finger CCCH domain-containing protein 7-like isoform X1 n=1 Tax=Typha angustifolia TaxID=59011 RepID=UPI003C2D7612
MANPPSSSGLQLQTPNPDLGIFPRRRHLDSASYRTLVRIFSQCLDLSLNLTGELSEDPNHRLDSSSSSRIEVPETSLDAKGGSASGGSGSKKEDSASEDPSDGNLALDEVLGDEYGLDDACANVDRLNDLVSDFSALIDVQDGVLCADDGLQDVQMGNCQVSCDNFQKDANGQVPILADELVGENKYVQNLSEETQKFKGIELDAPQSESLSFSVELMHCSVGEGNLESVHGVIVQDMLHEEPATVELENANSKSMEGVEERAQEESNCCLNPITDVSESDKLNRGVDMVVSLVDNEEIEEGEIPDDVQQLEECSDIENVDETLKDQKAKEDSTKSAHLFDADGIYVPQNKGNDSSGFNSHGSWPAAVPDAASLPVENFNKAASENKGRPPSNEASNAEKKRKRVLTDERKAKRKKSKRIKRAQKERAQGVKRLKLQPVVKPKVVVDCKFYLAGRCQQGDLCKFSHDTTPSTKSKACKHFACGSCLKGDDCPFDHQLSKYPCHNILSKGMCIRGDNCKFSHDIHATEASSVILDVKKLDTPLSEQLHLRKQMYLQNTSTPPSDVSRTTASATPSHKHLESTMVKSTEAPMVIPRGVRFLSFGRKQSCSSNKHQDDVLVETNGSVEVSTQTNQGRFPVEGHKNDEKSSQRSLLTEHEPNMSLSKASKRQNNIFVSEFVSTSSSNNLQSEVSEASKILEEFLFGASS